MLTPRTARHALQERTKTFYFSNGMATGAAKYIATGRSYASMTSSFVDLYQRYAMGRVSDKLSLIHI